MKRVLASLGIALSAMVHSPASVAADVVVWGESPFGVDLSAIAQFYDAFPTHTGVVATGQLNTISLAGIELLWAVQPSDSYTAAELATMSSFLAGGGRIAFMGEHGTIAPNQNNRISAALAALGSTISIQNTVVDAGFRSASVADGQILAHPLTTGVNTYRYAAFAPLLVSGTAEVLMRGEENPLNIMMAYQNIGAGSVFLITDQNVWDNVGSWGSFDNARMFENLLIGDTGAPPSPNQVPAPSALASIGLGLLGMALLRRRRTT